ncbi:MAG: general secretion pathway protein GspK [Hyphomicrobiales bacterium]|nr:general secretion pathway protein GspK [Hyphomicrobiales bacterium]
MPDSRQRGVALVAVLWVLMLLSFLAAGFSSTARTEVSLSRNLVDNAKAEALADAGVSRAVMLLIAPLPDRGIRVSGQAYAWEFADGEVRFAVWDENGKIDLNAASDDVLISLFRAAGLSEKESEALVDRIADYRDPDSDSRPMGAEDRDYYAAERPYGAKDRDFQRVDELRQVLGMDGAVYRAVRPVLTVFSSRRSPDLKVASPIVKEIFEAGVFPTHDQDFDAEPLDEQIGTRPSRTSLTDEEAVPVAKGSGIYLIHSEGQTLGGGVFVREAIVQIPGPENELYGVFEWRQGRRALFPIVSAGSLNTQTDG